MSTTPVRLVDTRKYRTSANSFLRHGSDSSASSPKTATNTAANYLTQNWTVLHILRSLISNLQPPTQLTPTPSQKYTSPSPTTPKSSSNPAPSCTRPNSPYTSPPCTRNQADAEVELALVIGRDCKNVSAKKAGGVYIGVYDGEGDIAEGQLVGVFEGA